MDALTDSASTSCATCTSATRPSTSSLHGFERDPASGSRAAAVSRSAFRPSRPRRRRSLQGPHDDRDGGHEVPIGIPRRVTAMEDGRFTDVAKSSMAERAGSQDRFEASRTAAERGRPRAPRQGPSGAPHRPEQHMWDVMIALTTIAALRAAPHGRSPTRRTKRLHGYARYSRSGHEPKHSSHQRHGGPDSSGPGGAHVGHDAGCWAAVAVVFGGLCIAAGYAIAGGAHHRGGQREDRGRCSSRTPAGWLAFVLLLPAASRWVRAGRRRAGRRTGCGCARLDGCDAGVAGSRRGGACGPGDGPPPIGAGGGSSGACGRAAGATSSKTLERSGGGSASASIAGGARSPNQSYVKAWTPISRSKPAHDTFALRGACRWAPPMPWRLLLAPSGSGHRTWPRRWPSSPCQSRCSCRRPGGRAASRLKRAAQRALGSP